MDNKKSKKVVVITERPSMCDTEYYYVANDEAEKSELSEPEQE